MKKHFFLHHKFLTMLLSLGFVNISYSQCPNVGFENCDFSGWTGTFSQSTDVPATGGTESTTCAPGTGPCLVADFASGCFVPCTSIAVTAGLAPDPFRNSGLAIGAVNQASNATPENSHFIMNSGFDAVVGNALPVVNPNNGGSCSARLGNEQQRGGGESLMYKYVVDANNTSFTYSYAVVLDGGSHDEFQQPYFKIRMWAYSSPSDSAEIVCATYDVNGVTAPQIGGFIDGGGFQWKNWSSVTVPLSNYIGQTVAIQFITKDCCPACNAEGTGASSGGHYAYCYIDASCDPLEIIPSAPAVCAGQNMTLTAPSAGSYSWSGPSVVSGGSSQVATVNQPGEYIVEMTTLSNSPCTYSLSVTMPGNLPGGANVTVNSANTCVGGSATLTASGGLTYSWAPGGETTESITVSPGSTTTYTVTGSSGSCGSGTVEGTVTVTPIPTSPFTVTPVCANEGSTITYTGNASPSDTYDWDFAGGTVISGSGQGPYSVSWPTSGTKNVSLTVTVGTCVSPPTTVPVTVNPSPVVTLTPSTICDGETGTITAAGADAYEWSDASTGASFSDSPSSTTTYTVTGTSAGCTDTKVGTISVNPIPTITVNDPIICEGNTANITASGADTYLWSDGSTSNTLSVSPSATTSYTVTGTSLTCSSTGVSTVTISLKPTLTVNNPTICSGQTATLTANGGASYDWETGETGNTISVSPTTTTTYTVGDNTPGCSGSTTSTVTINPPPTITVSNPVICQGNPAGLIASGADTYVWSDGSTVNPLVVSPSSTTTYSVVGTDINGCTGNGSGMVTITLKPVITVNSPTICIGESVLLTASGGATYDWETNETGNTIVVSPTTNTSYTVGDNTPNCSGSTISNVTVNPLPLISINSQTICEGETAILTASGASTYVWDNGSSANPLSVSPTNNSTYTVTGTDENGCVSTQIANVSVNPLPVVTVDSSAICKDLSTSLTASGALSYLWSNGSTSASTSFTPNKTTTYTVTGTDANGCKGSAPGTVTVFPKPDADFNVAPNPAVVSYPTITFTDLSSPDVSYWHWDFGDGDTLAPLEKNPVHTYPKVETTYDVTLVVHNAGFCYNTITRQVVIGPEYSFFIPNAFSPNADGENDTFFGKGKGIIEYELMIFDRWGNFIFYADDIDVAWDGKANDGSEVAQQDVYVWKVNLKDVFKKKHSFIGTVSLIRGD